MIRNAIQFECLLADIRDFVRTVAIPNEERVEREDRIPEEIVNEMRRRGYFGWSIPEAYGGAGLTTEELALANIELSQCSVAYRARVGMNTGVGAEALVQDGSEELKQKYLPRMAAGELTGALALTEVEAGSEATALKSSGAELPDGYFRLNGHKRYITLAPIADVFTVFVRTEPDSKKSNGITAFQIERGTKGLGISEPTPKMGQDGAPIGEVFLDDCIVHERAIVGARGQGFRTMLKALNKQRINLAALSTGPAIRLLNEAVAYAKERRQFGSAIGEFQLVQAMLADCKVEVEAARALITETARKRDRGEDVTMDVSLCKYFATEMCGRVADRVVQIFGGQGYVKQRGIERFYRDVRAFRIYEGTSQIHQLNIARLLLREPQEVS
ncbi:acyl-CoA dehydrogenase family protein [Bradyrhizobium mercantei]|uniref:acyl-CoA dehydrogenase family protein n=1 Tax=Bradyrhizobium mercantei TaxID=1904807 RepID=UPI0009770A80|nr:acyl-CoA dehydrogenase family protein [Bradyrhizobium mercantei]